MRRFILTSLEWCAILLIISWLLPGIVLAVPVIGIVALIGIIYNKI